MSAVVAMPPVKPGENDAPSVSLTASAAVPFHYTQTESFGQIQRGRVYLFLTFGG